MLMNIDTTSKPITLQSKLRIGYAPYDDSLQQPGDRRRFCYYAAMRGIQYEIADPSEEYDLVIVSGGADITTWSRYRPGSAKVIYEPIDPYLTSDRTDMRNLLGAISKFALGKYRYFALSEREAVRKICNRADAIVCSTPEQREGLSRYSNVHVILDFHGGDIMREKEEYSAGETFNFVWDGLGGNVVTFRVISDVIARIAQRRKIAFHIITSLRYGMFLGGRVIRRNTLTLAEKYLPNVTIHEWNIENLARMIPSCDLAIIPLPLNHWAYSIKPENKLLFFWRAGVPVVTSASPSYLRCMNSAGTPELACRTEAEWDSALNHCMDSEDYRARAAGLGRQYINQNQSEETLLQMWDRLMSSVGAFVATATENL
jgi:hypothetical protein